MSNQIYYYVFMKSPRYDVAHYFVILYRVSGYFFRIYACFVYFLSLEQCQLKNNIQFITPCYFSSMKIELVTDHNDIIRYQNTIFFVRSQQLLYFLYINVPVQTYEL